MSRRPLQRTLSIAATLAVASQGFAYAQSPFPRSSMQPSPYTGQLAGAPPVSAPPAPTGAGAQTVRVDLSGPAAASRMMALPRGKSAIIELPVDARDVLVSDPDVADVVLSTPRRIYVLGSSAGQTDAVFFDATGRQILNLNIRVDQDVSSLLQTLSRVVGNSAVKVEALNDKLILSGEVASAAEADRVVRLAQAAAGKPELVINMLSIAAPEQVMLKVRIVEVDRGVVKQLGFNNELMFSRGGSNAYGFAQTATFGANGAILGGATACAGQDTSRTTNYSNSTNNSTSTTGTSNSSTNSSSGSSSNFGTNSANSTSTGASNANGTSFSGSSPSTITVVDVNGNVVTIPGTLGATSSAGGNFSNTVTSSSNGSDATNSASGSSLADTFGSTVAGAVTSAATSTFTRVLGNQLSSCLAAFERVGLVRTLAEPNLTAVSGEAAKFLAGGEFPVPVGQDNAGRVTVTFKPFGVGLGFTPVVLSNGRISLKLSTEFSEITNVASFSMATGGSSSIVIPGLNVRRTETTVELPSGGGMMISGLLQNVTKQTLDSLPGLMQLPVLGQLFRSRDYMNNESELVVIVTPYLVKAVDPKLLQTPADGLVVANDLQSTLLGRLNQAFGRAPARASAGVYQGPYGYVVD